MGAFSQDFEDNACFELFPGVFVSRVDAKWLVVMIKLTFEK